MVDRKLERTALYGTGKRYRPHLRDPSGREVTKAFDREIDAQRWPDDQTVALVRGNYVHPQARRGTVVEWAETLAGRPITPQAEDARQLPVPPVHPGPADVGHVPLSMLGYASAAMTVDRYGHLFGDELDAVADRMDAARADWMRTETALAQVHGLH